MEQGKLNFFEKVLSGISSLKIQGAEAIAKIAIMALAEKMQSSLAGDKKSFLIEALIHAQELKNTRPTEPMMRNELGLLISRIKNSKEEKVSALKKLISKEAKALEEESAKSKQKIFEHAFELIPDDSNLLIHCHSSTLIGALIYAHKKGKNFKVFCCETRPMYQGVKSAKELALAGVSTALIVDSAANLAISRKNISAVFVGADAIDWNGSLFNKIGTSQIALSAKENKIQVYSLANSLKFDFETKTMHEKIEERNPKEIYASQANFSMWNPAFDETPAKLISKFVTEKGAFPPKIFVEKMRSLEGKFVQ